MRVSITAALFAALVSAGAQASTTEYTFSLDNALGPTSGTVTGRIFLDFLSSPTASGTGPATSILIDTIAPGLEPSSVGTDAVLYDVVAFNSFTVAGGEIVDFRFGSAVSGPLPTFNLCLNNGPQFDIPGTLALCLQNEIGYGNSVSQFVYNQGGASGVTFANVSQVPPPPSAVLLVAAAGALALLRVRRRAPGA